MILPQDDFILLSFVNTKLRDGYSCLSDMCAAEGVEEEEITFRLKAAGYEYDKKTNSFRII